MSTSWKLFFRIWIPLASLLTMSACGGGGGGVGSAIPSGSTVNGTAAKGLVKQAQVLVCKIVNGTPEADSSCASTISGNDGSFTVTLLDNYMGPAMIKVMPGTASMMLDETSGNYIPYNMTMRAMVPEVSASTTVYVTPFSEMAASAVGMTNIDSGKISQAIATVQTLMAGMGVDLGVMPLPDLMKNGSDPTMLGKQSNMTKQLARVMLAAKEASSLKDSNGTPCNAAGTSTTQQITCVINEMNSLMTSVATTDQTKAAVVINALNSQNITAVYMPIIRADGTLDIELVDMTSSQSMQAAMQNAGMMSSLSANAVNIMMQGMY